MTRAGFIQAGIEIQKPNEFEQLRAVLERVMAPAAAAAFLRALKSSGLRVREFESVLEQRLLERLDRELGGSGSSARALYEALTVSDQAQMREFYLTRLEQIDPKLRQKFHRQFETY